MQTAVLLSVKPQFASAILDGTKTFELRRAVFRACGVHRAVLYASMPVGRVVGEFEIAEVLAMELDDLWHATRHGSGIDRAYFDRYFHGRTSGYALRVRAARRYPRPRHLGRHYGIGHPPQSFRYLESRRDCSVD